MQLFSLFRDSSLQFFYDIEIWDECNAEFILMLRGYIGFFYTVQILNYRIILLQTPEETNGARNEH